MLLYYDLLTDKEVGTDSYDTSEPIPGVKAIQSKRLTITEGEVNVGGNPSSGGGEAGDEEETDAGVDSPEAKTVIDFVHSSQLQEIKLEKSEYKTMQKAYWKKLIDKLNRVKWDALGFPSDYVPSEDKTEAKKKETDAAAELGKFDRPPYEASLAKIDNFRKNFEGLQKFVLNDIVGNFEQCEFYLPESAELGESMIIPARYIGESTSPVFYLFMDGIKEKKA